MSVWVLVVLISSMPHAFGGGPAVIDNIVSMQECERVRLLLEHARYYSRCVEVRKVK